MRIHYRHFKVILDYAGAFIALLLALPLFVLIAIGIRLDSPGPIFYSQERVGRGGRLFRILKFRSMRNRAESLTGPVWSTQNDPRVTRLGEFLRKTHLDELPQLLNVLTGDMSLIGPRPERPEFVQDLKHRIQDYEQRLAVKPGITGLAQIRHRYDATLTDVRRKIRYDLIYIRKACLLMDLKIAAWTVRKMLRLAPGS